MASWAGAYGAGGAAEALEKIVAQKFLERKQAELERQARAQEQAEAAMRQMRADEFRASQGQRMTEFVSERDARYQDALGRKTEAERDRETRAAERKADLEARAADREDAQAEARAQLKSRQDFERSMLNATRGGGASPKDQIELERARLQLEAEKAKQAQAGKDREQQTEQASSSAQAAIASVDRLLNHGGLDSTYGAYELRRGRTQASADFQAERDRLVAMLALPNLGALKGPMSDKDLQFIKSISSTLSNEKISEKDARAELTLAKQFLQEKLGGGAAGGGTQQMTRTLRNRQTGETRTQTSTDGGVTWN